MAIKQIELKKVSDHKRTVKYETDDSTAVIKNVYLDRSFTGQMPSKIFVAVSDDPIVETKKPKAAG